MATEDERAAAFRASERAKKAYKKSANALMVGSAAALEVVEDAWEAVVKWQAERTFR